VFTQFFLPSVSMLAWLMIEAFTSRSDRPRVRIRRARVSRHRRTWGVDALAGFFRSRRADCNEREVDRVSTGKVRAVSLSSPTLAEKERSHERTPRQLAAAPLVAFPGGLRSLLDGL
jgi:hypothetical protein